MKNIILAQLAAIRANAEASRASAAAVEALIEAWGDIEPEASAGEPITDWNGVCRHERRINRATHGNPQGWQCSDCGFRPEEGSEK